MPPAKRAKTETVSRSAAERQRITLLVGRNAAARMERLRKLTEGWLDPDWRDFNYSEADAKGLNPADLLMTLGQIAVGDPAKHRVLVVRNVDGVRAADAEKLAEILPRVPLHSRLILVAEGDKTGRDTRLSSKLLKAAEAEGQVLDFPALRPNEAPAFISQRANEMGLRLSGDAPRLLAARVGPDTALLERELEKLQAAVEPNEMVTGAIINDLVPSSAEHSIFELTDAVGERNPAKALEAMQSLLASGQTIFLILPMLARQLRLVWQVKAERERIADAGLKEPSVARMGDWQKQKLQRQAQAFTWAALEDGLTTLFEVDLALKGIEEGGDDPQALLETVILRLCGLGVLGQRLVQPLH